MKDISSPVGRLTSRERELEGKRAKGQVSCAECRRLKLRCDKKLPCSSCVRRGCETICPNGSLAAGNGTRFVLANTDKLHEKLITMSQRIRQLEDALQIAQASLAPTPHPLLSEELLQVKSGVDLVSGDGGNEKSADDDGLPASFGVMSIADDGDSRFLGRASSESLMMLINGTSDPAREQRTPKSFEPIGIPNHLYRLTRAFPFTCVSGSAELFGGAPVPTASQTKTESLLLIESFLPSYARATSLVEAYLSNTAWFTSFVDREQIFEDLLPLIYDTTFGTLHRQSNRQHEQVEADADSNFYTHRLALLLMVLSGGAAGDYTLPLANDESERYKFLAIAALGLNSVFIGASVETVQMVMLYAGHDFCSCRKYSLEPAWKVMSFGLGLASSVGLHRDPAQWGLPAKLVQRRRRLFWEIFVIDKWKSLEAGRPATFNLREIDCQFPEDTEATISDDGKIVPGVLHLKHRFTREVIAHIAEKLCATRPIRYSEILELDRLVRDFNPGPLLAGSSAEDFSNATDRIPVQAEERISVLRKFSLWMYKEIALLYIHRMFFARAMLESPTHPLKSPFASSCLSAYASAVTSLKIIRTFFARYPEVMLRMWIMWAHALTAAVIVGAVACRGPISYVSGSALTELEAAVELFKQAHEHPVPRRSLPLLLRLLERSHEANVTPFKKEFPGAEEELQILKGTAHFLYQWSLPSSSRPEDAEKSATTSSSPSSGSEYRTNEKPNVPEKAKLHANRSSSLNVNPERLNELSKLYQPFMQEATATSMAMSMFAQPNPEVEAGTRIDTNAQKTQNQGKNHSGSIGRPSRYGSERPHSHMTSVFGPEMSSFVETSSGTPIGRLGASSSKTLEPSTPSTDSLGPCARATETPSMFTSGTSPDVTSNTNFDSTSWLQELSQSVCGALGQSPTTASLGGSFSPSQTSKATSTLPTSGSSHMQKANFDMFCDPRLNVFQPASGGAFWGSNELGAMNTSFETNTSEPKPRASGIEMQNLIDPTQREPYSQGNATTSFSSFPQAGPASIADSRLRGDLGSLGCLNGQNRTGCSMNVDEFDAGEGPASLAPDAWRAILGDPELLVYDYLRHDGGLA